MPSTTATARSSAPSSSPKKFYKGGYGREPKNASPWQRNPKRQLNKKVPKNGKPPHCQSYSKRPNNDYPKPNVLLHRLSQPSSPGTLLERIGGSVEDELSNSDWIESDSEGPNVHINLPFSATPHFYTPEPGEVERFLESVIGAPPAPPSPSGSAHAGSGIKPSVALETHNPRVDPRLAKVESIPDYVLYSPTQTTVDSLPSASHTPFDHWQQSAKLPGGIMPPSPSTLEECRKLLVPVLLASAQARDPARRPNPEECLRLLSDDQCSRFIRKAKEIRLQLASLLSQKTLMNRGRSGGLKRHRADEEDGVRNAHTRFNSVNTVVSDASRRDSDVTLVGVTGGGPPKAPRAMLQAASQGSHNALRGAPYQSWVGSPTSEEPASKTSLIELIQQAFVMFPTLIPPSQPAPEADTTNLSMGSPDQLPEHSAETLASTEPAPSSSPDVVLHLPTQPGIWFKQQGRQFAQIVNVDIEVSDDMFYSSTERQPYRLRMHLRLCSVPVDATTNNENGDTALQDIDGAIERQALQWPKHGKLVVQVNPEAKRGKTWLPHTLVSDPLDVTSCVQPGKNVFRFIQLSDLSEFTFALVASPPPPEEAWRSWDWASLVESPRARSSPPSPSTDDPTSSLAEFARIPITILS